MKRWNFAVVPPGPEMLGAPLRGVRVSWEGVPSLSIKQRRCSPHQLLISSPHHIHQKCHDGVGGGGGGILALPTVHGTRYEYKVLCHWYGLSGGREGKLYLIRGR